MYRLSNNPDEIRRTLYDLHSYFILVWSRAHSLFKSQLFFFIYIFNYLYHCQVFELNEKKKLSENLQNKENKLKRKKKKSDKKN